MKSKMIEMSFKLLKPFPYNENARRTKSNWILRDIIYFWSAIYVERGKRSDSPEKRFKSLSLLILYNNAAKLLNKSL